MNIALTGSAAPGSETNGTMPVAEAEFVPDPKRWFILAVVVLATLMVVLDASIVTIALPSAQRSLHISVANRQWVITAYTLAFGGLLLLGGRIADFGGRRRVFIVGLIGFATASALGGAARQSMDALRFPRGAGCLCRAHGSCGPVDLDHHIFTRRRGTSQGLRRLRSGLGRRRRDRRAARRCPHTVRIVAVVPLHQRSDRLAGSGRGFRVIGESRASGTTQLRHPGRTALDGWTGQFGLRIHQGGD